MNKHITSAILVILFSTICIVQAIETKQRKPVIGILTQPSGFIKYPEQKYSYIFSSYVEYFERNGAQTIFIKYNWSYEKIDKILNSINGIVIPGGGSNLFFKNGKSKTYTDFAIKGKYIIEQVINKNREGNYFPLWGTCLGFELIQIVFANNNYQILKKREGRNHSGQIEVFPDQLIKSRMFKGFTDYESLRYVQENPALFFNHKFGVKYEDYQNKYQQTKIFRVIGISHDLNGRNFISMAEHKEFPFYGVQFHPEKNRYDFDPNLPINHEELGKKFTDYLSKFFVNECKKNNQIYKNKRELTLYSLKNYKTFRVKDYTMRVYFFNKNRNDQKKLLPDNQSHLTMNN